MAQEIEIPPLKVGETYSEPHWSSGPTRVVHVFDARTNLRRNHPAYGRGYIGVRESGNIDVFWHHWQKQPDGNFGSVLAHHGGMYGFPDIEIPIRQCRRIIAGYLGIEEAIEETEGLAEAEIHPPVNLREFADILGTQTIFVPGAAAWAMDIKTTIDRAIRQVISRPGYLNLGTSVNILQNMRQKLTLSTNPFLQETGEAIEEALLSDDRFKKMEALQRGGQSIIGRMAQIDSMVLSVMQRHNRLEAHRSYSESVATSWALEVFRQKAKLDAGEDTATIAQKIKEASIEATGNLITNPFKERTQKLYELGTLGSVLEMEGPNRVAMLINKGVIELSFWKDEIREARRGRFRDRYPVN